MSTTTISQEYFDEVCLENHELFEGTKEEAVSETIQQLVQQQQSSSSSSNADEAQIILEHLVQSFPDEAGLPQRDNRKLFRTALQTLHTDTNELHAETLLLIQTCLSDNQQQHAVMYKRLFLLEGGYSVYLKQWNQLRQQQRETLDDRATEMEGLLLETLDSLLAPALEKRIKVQLESFQEAMTRSVMSTWLAVYQECLSQQQEPSNSHQQRRAHQLALLAVASCKGCEANKKKWLSAKTTLPDQSVLSLPGVLVSSLKHVIVQLDDNKDDVTHESAKALATQLCRFVTVLCTFDDFRPVSGPTGSVQSGHATVTTLAQQGLVLELVRLLRKLPEAPVILAIRAMAIQDEVVQSMVAAGILDLAVTIFHSTSNDLQQQTACLGLFRNLAANDEIKTSLCTGDQSIVLQTVQAMQHFLHNQNSWQLQEHACGTVAAMALRQPGNAKKWVAAGVHVCMMRALQIHPGRAPLCRQAALAIRNLVARSPELQTPILQEAPTEQVLRAVAARHASVQDEVYAALRDLGLSAKILNVKHDEAGRVVAVEATPQFGQARNTNFRAVYD